jgi:hypothetical protein
MFGEGRLRPNDVGRKRNLALLLAAGLQWRSVLFLDDDMFDVEDGDGTPHERHAQTLDTPSLRAAVRAVTEGGQLAVGWAGREFDDNSVLCRMAARTGARQDQFIGGGALLVPIGAQTPFFPSIYNEDWLFVLAMLRRRRPGALDVLDGGDVHQDEYPAFLASRAAAEELGDILGEGMLSLLHDDAADQLLVPAFWRKALQARRALKDRLREQVAAAATDPLQADMLRVLDALDVIHQQFMASVGAWNRDLRTWGRRLHPDDLPAPRNLVGSKEIDAARTFGSPAHPDDFLRRFAGATDARRGTPVRV